MMIYIKFSVRLPTFHPQCIDQLTVAQAELQDSVKELTKSRKKYQEAETMAQAVREKAELDAKYELLDYIIHTQVYKQMVQLLLPVKHQESSIQLILIVAVTHREQIHSPETILMTDNII